MKDQSTHTPMSAASGPRSPTADNRTTLPRDLMHEKVVMKRYGHLFSERELREARNAGQIGWFDLRKGPHYTDAQIMEYLAQKERSPCPDSAERNDQLSAGDPPAPTGSSKSAGSGSNGRNDRRTSPTAGMTPELERHAASQLASKT